jgi:2-phosphoglycerate kinase
LGHLLSDDQVGRLKRDLAHVLWIGGSPAAGKSTIARILARDHGLTLYDFDRHEPAHVERRMTEASLYPAYTSFRALTMDQRWLSRPADEMAAQVIALWTERFRLVVDDVRALPVTSPVVAEGSGLFPDCVQPVIDDANQAIWLVPTPAFCRTVRLERDAGAFVDTSNPVQALDNVIERDNMLAAYVKRRAVDLGLTVVEVDGTTPLDEMAAMVEQHFVTGARCQGVTQRPVVGHLERDGLRRRP